VESNEAAADGTEADLLGEVLKQSREDAAGSRRDVRRRRGCSASGPVVNERPVETDKRPSDFIEALSTQRFTALARSAQCRQM